MLPKQPDPGEGAWSAQNSLSRHQHGCLGYPLNLATEIAVREVRSFLLQQMLPDQVIFACFSAAAAATYRQILGSDGISNLQWKSQCKPDQV